jgi:hypothetical protein
MYDPIDALKRPVHEFRVADVSVDELDALRQLWAPASVYLWLEAVQQNHLVAAGDESARQM